MSEELRRVYLKRRNSTVEIHPVGDGACVTKRYHARHNVSDEWAAYLAASELATEITNLRMAQVLWVDREDNSIRLEYVEGSTLAQRLADSGIDALVSDTTQPVIRFLALAQKRTLMLDVDPSNIIIAADGSGLVLVDPVAVDMGLEHGAATVFFWGLVKYRVRFVLRAWEFPGFIRQWRVLVSNYVGLCDVQAADLYRDLSLYIAEVVRWNKGESHSEGLVYRSLRRIAVVPLWKCLEKFFWYLSRRLNGTGKTT